MGGVVCQCLATKGQGLLLRGCMPPPMNAAKEVLLPVVNSPRMGVGGSTGGPA